MAATSTNIVNIALRSLGVAKITALTDDSEPARVMNDLYEPIRDEMMECHPWNFAIVYSDTLAENATAPKFDYDYSYALPADCLRVIELEDAEDEYKVVGDNLYTDTQDPKIKYISLVTTTGNFSKSFVTAFAARLAAEACYALTQNRALSGDKWKEYEVKLHQAKGADSQEGTTEKIEDCSWIDDRE
jgi:hypothetical protein